MQNLPVAVSLATRNISYLQYNTNRTCQQQKPGFACIHPICNIISPIVDQFRYFFSSMIMPWSSNVPWFWPTQIPTESWSKKEVWVLMWLKCSFSSPGRWRFLAILVCDTKMSRLTLCFSIFLYRLVAKLEKSS